MAAHQGIPLGASGSLVESWQLHQARFLAEVTCFLPRDVSLNPFLKAPYCNGLYIINAHPTEKIIVPDLPERGYDLDDKDDETQPRPFEEVSVAEHLRNTHAMIVGTRIGEGFLAYVGDVNPAELNSVILGLCGLPFGEPKLASIYMLD